MGWRVFLCVLLGIGRGIVNAQSFPVPRILETSAPHTNALVPVDVANAQGPEPNPEVPNPPRVLGILEKYKPAANETIVYDTFVYRNLEEPRKLSGNELDVYKNNSNYLTITVRNGDTWAYPTSDFFPIPGGEVGRLTAVPKRSPPEWEKTAMEKLLWGVQPGDRRQWSGWVKNMLWNPVANLGLDMVTDRYGLKDGSRYPTIIASLNQSETTYFRGGNVSTAMGPDSLSHGNIWLDAYAFWNHDWDNATKKHIWSPLDLDELVLSLSSRIVEAKATAGTGDYSSEILMRAVNLLRTQNRLAAIASPHIRVRKENVDDALLSYRSALGELYQCSPEWYEKYFRGRLPGPDAGQCTPFKKR